MNRKVATIVTLVVVGFVALAQAHVIRMNDGRVFKGRFVGGDKTHVFFHVDGDTIQKFPLANITAIQFQTYTGGGDQLTSTESVTIPQGTPLRVRVEQQLSSQTANAGDNWFGTLVEAVSVSGKVIAPRGKRVFGRITKAVNPRRGLGDSVLEMEIAAITVAGKKQPVVTDVFGIKTEDSTNSVYKTGPATAIGTSITAFSVDNKIIIHQGTVLQFQIKQPVIIRGTP